MITITAKITLADGTEIPLNKRNLISIDSAIFDRSDIILPSWGILSNSGNFSFIDIDGNVKGYAQNLKLTSKTKVNIYLNDTSYRTQCQLGEFFSGKWNYDNDNANVSTTLTDGLQQMQDINIEPLEFDPITDGEQYSTADKLYDYLQKQTVPKGFNMIAIDDDDFDSATKGHLEKCRIPYPYINTTNLWRVWQQFAEAFQLHIFKKRNGKIVCFYRGGD